MEKYESCPMWEKILLDDAFSNKGLNNLKTEKNYKIAQYNPKSHGVFFLNNITYNVAKALGEKIFLLKKIQNRNHLGGFCIEYSHIEVDLDYLQALEECLFVEDIMPSIFSILEIGAGYGRSCHALLSLYPHIESYSIVDFPVMLDLCSQYLQKVLSKEQFSKIKFLDFQALRGEEGKGTIFDLVINIDSMQEMPEGTVLEYLNFIHSHGKNFYTKNTIGKFSPHLVHAEDNEELKIALRADILRDIVNIFCPQELAIAQEAFLVKFCPSSLWKISKHASTLAYSHYYQALYCRALV